MTMVEIPIVVAMTWVSVEEVDLVMAHHNTGVILTCISCSLIMEFLFKQGKTTFEFLIRIALFSSVSLLYLYFFPNVSRLLGLATFMTWN